MESDSAKRSQFFLEDLTQRAISASMAYRVVGPLCVIQWIEIFRANCYVRIRSY